MRENGRQRRYSFTADSHVIRCGCHSAADEGEESLVVVLEVLRCEAVLSELVVEGNEQLAGGFLLVLADRDQTGRVGTDGSDPRGDRGASESGRSESVSQSVRSGLTQ